MKLRDYFLLGIVVSTVFACTSDEDVPEVHVFTPDATLSLTTEVNGVTSTKAANMTKAIFSTDAAEDEIHTLHVLVFSGKGEEAVFQTDRYVSYVEAVDGKYLVPDIEVESGQATVLVLANEGTKIDFSGKKLSEVLDKTFSLETNEVLATGLTMSSALREVDITPNMHNILGAEADFSGGEHTPSVLKGSAIDLVRHVAQINLKSVSISADATFELDQIFVANVKGYSKIASFTTTRWDAVEAMTAPANGKMWKYGSYVDAEWNGKYKTTNAADCILNSDGLLFTPSPKPVVSSGNTLKPEEGARSYGKSFFVYENKGNNNTPLGQRTLLVLKGTYTGKDGVAEKDRFYTVSINDPDMKGSTSTESDAKTSHNFIKRNFRYNISLTIKSNGSDRPYDPVSEACMDVAIKVADWEVVDMDENLD